MKYDLYCLATRGHASQVSRPFLARMSNSTSLLPATRGLKVAVALIALPLVIGTAQAAEPAPSPGPAASPVTAPSTSDQGQDTPETSKDIIVTGLSRSESLLKAPAAITVFTSKTIADARIKDVSDFIALTPNVSVIEAQNSGSSFVTIRGISQVRNGQSPVAIVVDGVQQADPRQFSQDLFNTDQIEVLRGPQGSLYGRNAIGGAIVITTKQPTEDLHTSFAASGGNGGDYRAQAAISGPIIQDKLLFRVSGNYHHFDGLLENVYLNTPVDYYREWGLRGQLKALVTDNFTLDGTIGVNNNRGGALNYHYQSVVFDPNRPCFKAASQANAPVADANRVDRTFCSDILGLDTRDVFDASLRASYKLPFATITNALGYVNITEYYGGPSQPYTADLGKTTVQFSRNRALSDDFRITSNTDGRFRWMVGGYYLDERHFLSSTKGNDTGAGVFEVSYAPLTNFAPNPTTSFIANRDHNHEYSLFTDLSYDITTKLTAEFGYRYDWSVLNQFALPINTSTKPAGCTVATPDSCNRPITFKKGQPKVTLSYKLSDDINLFTDYGVGFRTGQFNQPGAAQQGGFAPGVADITLPEVANTFEIGGKGRFLDGRLRLSATYFDTVDKNSFYFIYVASVGAQILLNIDKIHLYGGEIEATYTPIKGLDLFASYGRTVSTIKAYAFNPADVGKTAPYIPGQSATAGAQYRFPLSERINGLVRGNVEVHGKQYWDPENVAYRSQFALVNLQVGVEDPKNHWSAHAFVKNLFDKAYNAEYVSGGFAQPAEPRTFGGEVRFDF